jgi:hypothetical protein
MGDWGANRYHFFGINADFPELDFAAEGLRVPEVSSSTTTTS